MPSRAEYRTLFVQYEKRVNEIYTPVQIASMGASGTGAPVEIDALWDTGAEVSCIKQSLWDKLKLRQPKHSERTVISGIGGDISANSASVRIWLTSDLLIRLWPVYVVDFPGDAELLIGMDIITLGDFAICNSDGKTSVSFAVPPFPDRVDFAKKAGAANEQSTL